MMNITIDDFLQGLADDGYPFTENASNPEFCLQHGWHDREHHCPACRRHFLAQLGNANTAFDRRRSFHER
ncbi:hypothetical protein ACIRS1_35035 [Kitasatospora sp. NPDC101176]|uniref:hypothetical protein n=1 Tax=Kitasatospora sp. NPDC101176 TaxID=3364099 RepID=UPI0037F983DB